MADDDQVPVDARAFEAAVSDLSGATTSYGSEGRTFDIKAALDAAPDKGLIVVDANQDTALAEALNVHLALRDAKVPKGAEERLQREAQKAADDAAASAPEPEPVGAESVEAAADAGQTTSADA